MESELKFDVFAHENHVIAPVDNGQGILELTVDDVDSEDKGTGTNKQTKRPRLAKKERTHLDVLSVPDNHDGNFSDA